MPPEAPAFTREEHRAERFEPGWEEPTRLMRTALRRSLAGECRLTMRIRAEPGAPPLARAGAHPRGAS